MEILTYFAVIVACLGFLACLVLWVWTYSEIKKLRNQVANMRYIKAVKKDGSYELTTKEGKTIFEL